jgi:hypothetical protein
VEKSINIYDHFENVIERLSRQIESKYQVGFKYFSAEQWRELEVSKNIPINNSQETIRVSIVVTENDTYLPVTVRGDLACTIKLSNTTHLTGNDLSTISDAIDTLIGGSIDLLQRVEALDHDLYFKEKHLVEDVLDTDQKVESNVVSMEQFSYLRKGNEPVTAQEFADTGEEVKEKVISDLPIFIHANDHVQVFKIGHEVFTYTDKLACLRLNDLRKKDEDLTVEFLKSLGNICLIIPELNDLSQESIDIIIEYYLEQKREANSDLLIIFGSTIPAAELIASKKLTVNSYRMISATRISHLEEDLTQGQLEMHVESLLRSQKDLHVLTLLSQMGLSAFNVDDLV